MKLLKIVLIGSIFSGCLALADTKPVLAKNSDIPSLRIMTFNIRRQGKEEKKELVWNRRLPLVAEVLTSTQPDIIGFQEATQEQINDLKVRLSGYKWFGEGRGSSWFGLGADEYTPLFYNTGKFTLLGHGTFLINHVKLLKVKKTGWLPRICTWGKFREKSSGKEFYVYNTHLDNSYQKARLKSLEIIKRDIDKRAFGCDVILMGDFNTALTTDIKKSISGFYPLKDLALQKRGPKETHTGWDSKESTEIDHILINDACAQVLSYEVISSQPPYPSDHNPVIADLVI